MVGRASTGDWVELEVPQPGVSLSGGAQRGEGVLPGLGAIFSGKADFRGGGKVLDFWKRVWVIEGGNRWEF